MADLTDNQFLATDPEVLGLQRQRQLANLLTGQAFNQPQGQMISGHYVAPSALQQALPMINAAIGGLTNANLDTKQLELANALRQKQATEIEEFGQLQQKDPDAALKYALSSNNPILRDMAKEELKGIKLGEGEVFTRKNLGGGTTELKGNAKYHAPTSVDMGTLGTMLIHPDGRREMVQKGIQGPAGQVVETANGPMLVNTRTGQAQPIMSNGQPLASNKPLSEGPMKQVTGATNLQSAIKGYQEKLKDFTTLDFANPNARAEMGNAYNNMMLQAKEAYNLGVLNGPDYKILTSIVTDPTSPSALLVSKDTLNNQAKDLSKNAENIIKNVYQTHGRKAPEQPSQPKLRYNLQTGQWE